MMIATVLLLGLLAPQANAAEGDHTDHGDDHHHVSITLSPIQLAWSMAELTTELRLREKVGLGVVLGYGKPDGLQAFELGTQARYYPIGGFDHGMQLGLESLILRGSASQAGASASGNGFAVGPFVGYKIAASFGLTFEGQLGAQYLAVAAKSNGGTATTWDDSFIPLLNLNLGWSF